MATQLSAIEQCSYAQQSDNKPSHKVEFEKREYIRLYPGRYSVYKKGATASILKKYIYKEAKSQEAKNYGYDQYYGKLLPNLSDDNINSYYYYPMPVRDGWIYLADNSCTTVYEFESLDYQFPLRRKIRTDSRSVNSELDKYEKVLKKEGTQAYVPLPNQDGIHLFYSEVRISQKHIIDHFFNLSRIICRSFDAQSWAISDGFSQTNVKNGLFDIQDTVIFYNEKILNAESCINSIKTGVYNNLNKEQYRDVFVELFDPIAVAEQISDDLQDLQLDHEAMLRSIRTGIAPEIIRQRLSAIIDKEEYSIITDDDLFEDDTNAEQIKIAHSIAVNLYQMGYKKGSSYRRDKRSMDKEKLEKVLAVKERKELRNAIENQRTTLAEAMRSQSFLGYCAFWGNAEVNTDLEDEASKFEHAQMIQNAKLSVIRSYLALSVPSNVNDNYIDIEEYSDPQKDIFNLVLDTPDCTVGKLLYKQIDIIALETGVENLNKARKNSQEEILITEISLGTILLIDSIADSFWRFAYEAKRRTVFVQMLQRSTNPELFVISQGEIEKVLKSRNLKNVTSFENIEKGVWAIRKDRVINEELGKIKLDTVSASPSKRHRVIKSIAQNKTYTGIMAIIAIMDIESIIKSWEKSVWLGAVRSFNLGTTVAFFRARYLEGKLTNVAKLGIKAVKNKASVISIIQKQIKILGPIGVALSAIDAGIMFLFNFSNDKDAAWAFAGSAVSGVLGFVVPIVFRSTAGGVAGLIFAGVSIGVYFLAQWLTDSDFEKFIKKTVFTDSSPKIGAKYHYNNKLPYEAINELSMLSWRKNYAGDDFFADYTNLLEEFTMCYAMNPKIDVSTSYIYGSEYFRRDGSVGSDLSEFRVKIKCDLTSYISIVQKIVMNIYFVIDNGIFSNYKERILSDRSTTSLDIIHYSQEPINNENAIFENFSANLKEGGNFRTYVRDNGYIVVLVKMKGVDGKMIPYKRDTGEDFLVYRYKILVEEKRHPNGYKYNDYSNAKAILEKVAINTKKNALKLK